MIMLMMSLKLLRGCKVRGVPLCSKSGNLILDRLDRFFPAFDVIGAFKHTFDRSIPFVLVSHDSHDDSSYLTKFSSDKEIFHNMLMVLPLKHKKTHWCFQQHKEEPIRSQPPHFSQCRSLAMMIVMTQFRRKFLEDF